MRDLAYACSMALMRAIMFWALVLFLVSGSESLWLAVFGTGAPVR